MVELLSPAGDKECFLAALYAGADAIYVGGKQYGARAYASNFEQNDLLECLHLAHLYGKKVYLTVNTLMKESELDGLFSFLSPFYEEGLDGVIVQDLGGLLRIAEAFPELELHASTQMTVTGPLGAGELKKHGVSRVVPARELSLKEIIAIKEETGLEIETFVHGAMCYGYSGQCLFSSMLGERSGNRGRCAGPCRLPYTVSNDGKRMNRDNEKYQLSLKDLCTLNVLPKLLDAGIDSFKIEGRMKTPEYVSFVTGMYRKYIDLYYNDPKNYKVSKQDMDLLKLRFSRGSIQPGYYFAQNGRELVTLDKPGYQSFSTENNGLTGESQKLDNTKIKEIKIDLVGHFSAVSSNPICLTLYKKGAPETTIAVLGDSASKAQNCPVTEDEVRKQICKTGNTPFIFSEMTFEMDDNLFLPKKALNELRRNALEELTAKMLAEYQRILPEGDSAAKPGKKPVNIAIKDKVNKSVKINAPSMHIEIRTFAQADAIDDFSDINRLYISSDLFTAVTDEKNVIDKLVRLREKCKTFDTEIFVTLPHVCRQKAIKNIDQQRELVKELNPDGFSIGNLESLAYIKNIFPNKQIITDAGMYVFNTKTTQFMERYSVHEHILPYELHRKEISSLIEDTIDTGHIFILPVYGYIPVMETAGCLLKTNGICRDGKGNEYVSLVDRHKKKRLVVSHCDRCENTIYNSVPLSLHKEIGQILKMSLSAVILKFTTEDFSRTRAVLMAWRKFMSGEPDDYIEEFTKGHFLKGVE